MPCEPDLRPAAAHFRHLWFQPTETFLHTCVRAFARSSPLLVGYEHVNADRFPVDCPVVPLYPRGSWRARWNARAPAWLAGDPLARFDVPRARAALAAHGTRVLHAHFGQTGWGVLPLKRRTGLPLVTTFYGADASQRSRLPGWGERYAELFAEGDLFLAEGPHLAARLKALGCPEQKVALHPITLEPDAYAFRERAPKPRGEPVQLLFCARLCEKKGLRDALRALAMARGKHPDLVLRVAGDGPDAGASRALAAELGVADAVHFLGFVTHERFLAELARADLFVQPSVTARDGDSEGGAPTTLLEAQACGLPTLATRHADIPHVVADGESGLLCNEGDAEALAENLLELLATPERWAAMGRRGRERVQNQHAAGPNARALEDRYQALVDRRS